LNTKIKWKEKVSIMLVYKDLNIPIK
jgi:hypothetical protein